MNEGMVSARNATPVLAIEGPGDDLRVAVRALDDLDPVADADGQLGRVAHDDADRLVASQMDTVAARAGTSKRSLYAHFESKDKLFLAVLDLVRELYLGRLKTPDAYAGDPAEAVTLFCGRFLQLMVWEPRCGPAG